MKHFPLLAALLLLVGGAAPLRAETFDDEGGYNWFDDDDRESRGIYDTPGDYYYDDYYDGDADWYDDDESGYGDSYVSDDWYEDDGGYEYETDDQWFDDWFED